jgi:SAM-dependent methyltransferase
MLKDRLKSLPPLYWLMRGARAAIGELLPPKQLPGVPGRIHANDVMMPSRVEAHVSGYVVSGEQIASLIGLHLPTSIRETGGRGLDLGCGHGRVLRHLITAFPTVRWTASDVDRSAVRFCGREFGVETVRSSRQLDEVQLLSGPYDLVWMGSLITHLDTASEAALWDLLRLNMRPGALLVFSTNGPTSVARLDDYLPDGSAHRERVAAELARSGRAYVAYRHYRRFSYGITLHTAEDLDKVIRQRLSPDAKRLAYQPDAWLGTQDLFVYELGNRLAP